MDPYRSRQDYHHQLSQLSQQQQDQQTGGGGYYQPTQQPGQQQNVGPTTGGSYYQPTPQPGGPVGSTRDHYLQEQRGPAPFASFEDLSLASFEMSPDENLPGKLPGVGVAAWFPVIGRNIKCGAKFNSNALFFVKHLHIPGNPIKGGFTKSNHRVKERFDTCLKDCLSSKMLAKHRLS
jgi:hypothetical protein